MKILEPILRRVTYDIGIDLGTANTLVALKGIGKIINEPSVVAINKQSGEILAVGEQAKYMIGRTPMHVVSVSPLAEGVIKDFDSTEVMMRYFINRVHGDYSKMFVIKKPRLIVGVPSKITEVEMRAVVDAGISAGAREVFLIEEPMAAAIGAGIQIEDARGVLLVDIGGGTTDVVLISMGGVVMDKSLRLGGNVMDDAIVEYVKSKYNILIGKKAAEQLKIEIGSALPLGKKKVYEVSGKNLISGLPNRMEVGNIEIVEAIRPVLDKIIDSVKLIFEQAPPEMISDLLENGIYLAGGGANIPLLADYFSENLKVDVIVVDDPLSSVVNGTEILLEEFDLLEKVRLNPDLIR